MMRFSTVKSSVSPLMDVALFHNLLFRQDWPHFVAFDLLQVDGEDVRGEPLITRKRRLRAIMPLVDSGVLYLPHVER
jgi:hypothetical protein